MYILPALIKVKSQFFGNIALLSSPWGWPRHCPEAAAGRRDFQAVFQVAGRRDWFPGMPVRGVVLSHAVFLPEVGRLTLLFFPLPERQN